GLATATARAWSSAAAASARGLPAARRIPSGRSRPAAEPIDTCWCDGMACSSAVSKLPRSGIAEKAGELDQAEQHRRCAAGQRSLSHVDAGDAEPRGGNDVALDRVPDVEDLVALAAGARERPLEEPVVLGHPLAG